MTKQEFDQKLKTWQTLQICIKIDNDKVVSENDRFGLERKYNNTVGLLALAQMFIYDNQLQSDFQEFFHEMKLEANL